MLSLPKHSILSHQTASLSAITHLSSASHTILNLSLCLLHEIRLSVNSKFYGYLQSLPRDMGAGLPLFWQTGEGVEAEDGERGLQWLKSTEAEKELRKSERQGLSLVGTVFMRLLYRPLWLNYIINSPTFMLSICARHTSFPPPQLTHCHPPS